MGLKNGVYKGQLVILWKIIALFVYYYSRSFIVCGPNIQLLTLRFDWKIVGETFFLHFINKISWIPFKISSYF